MIRRLYDVTMNLAAHPHALFWLAILTFAESSFFPIPPEAMIIPMVLARPDQAWRVVAIATIASVLGGFAGYGIGALAYESVGKPIIEFYSAGAKFETFQGWYREWGAWIVAAGGFTPIPCKVVTIASGVAGLDLTTFGAASLGSRGARFLLVAALLWKFGEPIRTFIEARLALLAAGFFIMLFLGFAVLKYLV